jgi:hypothetical protein
LYFEGQKLFSALMSGPAGDGCFDDSLIQASTQAQDARQVDSFRFDFSSSIPKLVQIAPIHTFKFLRELSLIGHSLLDASALQSLSRLRRLNLSHNQLRSLSPLLSLKYLEDLTVNNNRIISIPSEISALTKLRTLRLAFNAIDDRRDFARLRRSPNLVNFDIEGNPLARDPGAMYYCVFTLPHLEILNRNAISIEYRRQAAERFERFQIEELTLANEQLSRQNDELRGRLESHTLMDTQIQDQQTLVLLKERDLDIIRLKAALDDLSRHRDSDQEVRGRLDELRGDIEGQQLSFSRELGQLKGQLSEKDQELKQRNDETQQLRGQLETLEDQRLASSREIEQFKTQLGEKDREFRRQHDEMQQLRTQLGYR